MAGELEENNVVQNAKEGPAERLKSDKEVAGKKGGVWVRDDKQGIRRVGVDGGALQGKGPTERQSSINMEPLALDDDVMHDAKVLSFTFCTIASY